MASSPDSVPQRRLRSSSAHQRSMTPSRFCSPPPPPQLPSSYSTGSISNKRRRLLAPAHNTRLNGDEGDNGDESLKPCSVRRTYICKVCTFVSTNPRQFLNHQKDVHGLKQTIRDCPYCLYATIYTNKLIRHITLVHKKKVVGAKTAPKAEQPKSPSPPKLIPNSMYPGSISPSTLPPPSVAAKLVQNRPAMVLPPELEMIPVTEARKLNASNDGTSSTMLTRSSNKSQLSPVSAVGIKPKVGNLQNRLTALTGVFNKTASEKKLPGNVEIGIENCSLYSFKSVNKSMMERHEKVQFKKKFYRCNKCTYITNVRSRYTKHVRYHTMPYIKCELCDFSTPYKWNLDRHRKNHMEGPDGLESSFGSAMYRCHLCTFHTLTKQSLSGHLLNHHAEGGGRKRRRPIEEGGCYSEPEFSRHSDQMEDEDYENQEEGESGNEEGLRSKFGDESFKKQKISPEQNEAKKKVLDAANKPGLIKCDLCSYKAKWISEVIRHRRVHVTEKPFECSKCPFSSRWKGDLTRHMTKHHPEEPQDSVVEHIDELLDQSMMVGGADELEVYNQEREQQALKQKSDSRQRMSPRQSQATSKLPEIDLRVLGQLIKGQSMKQQITAPVQLSASVQLIPTNPQKSSAAVTAAAPAEKKMEDGPIIRKKYQCPHCSILFATTNGFNAHLQSHLKAYSCSECNFKGSETDVVGHLKRAISMNDHKHQAATVMKIKPAITMEKGGLDNLEKYAVYETVNLKKSNNGSSTDGASSMLLKNITKTSSIREVKLSTHKTKLGPNVIFKCKYCEFRDLNRRIILRHLQVHTANKPFWCGICGQSSNSKNTILRHCQVRHNVSGPIIQRDTASIHSGKSGDKDEAGELKEDDPGFVIVERNQDQNGSAHNFHNEIQDGTNGQNTENGGAGSTKVDKTDKRHRCSICPYRCRKMFDLKIHSYMHKPHKGADYKCTYCPFYVTLRGSLMNHMKLHTENGSDYECNLVSTEKESTPQQLSNETSPTAKGKSTDMKQKQNAAAAVKRYCCEHCPYSTNSHTSYFYHRQFHRPSKHSIFKCSTCSYSVSRLHLIHQHERVHVKSKTSHVPAALSPTVQEEEKSSIVEASSTQATPRVNRRQAPMDSLPTLPRVWVHRDGVFKKMFKCRHCPHVSKKRTVIFEHEKMHLLREAPGSKANYHCHLCNYSCMNGGILTSHMRVHKAQNSTNFYINEDLDEVVPTGQSGAGKSRWTSTPKATARKGISNLKHLDSSDMKDDDNDVTGSEVEQHQHGRQSSSYECDHCPARFTRLDKKNNHMRFHGTNMKYKCSYCSYTVKHRPHLHRHLAVHTEEYKSKSKFKNSAPSITTQTNISSMSNLSQISPGGSSTGIPEGKVYTCPQCPAVFAQESTLLYHLKMHYGNAKYKCGHCTYSVFTYSNLIRHARFHGIELPSEPPDVSLIPEAKKPAVEEETATFKCPKCPAVFDKKLGFDVHVSLHGSRQWFKCDRCDYSVKYEANLIRHRHLHDVHDEGKAIITSTVLSDEIANEMNSSAEFRNEVEHALGKQQLSDEKRIEEKRMERGDDDEGEVKKLFQCPKCPYTHLRKDAVESHLKRHTSSNSDTRCPHCDYGSSMQSFLREHIKLHFDTHRLRQVEAFAHWEELEVWVRSGNHKTLIYRYALGEKLFTENDCRTEFAETLSASANATENAVSKSNTEDEAEKADVEIGDKIDDAEKENVSESGFDEVEEEKEEEVEEEDDEEEEEVEDEEVQKEVEMEKDVPIAAEEGESTIVGAPEPEIPEVNDEKEVAEPAVPEAVEVTEDEKKECLEESTENSEKEVLESNTESISNENTDEDVNMVAVEEEQTTESTVIPVEAEEEPEIVTEETKESIEDAVEPITHDKSESPTIPIPEPPTPEDMKETVDKMDTSEEEIIVDVCSEENGEPLSLVANPPEVVNVVPEHLDEIEMSMEEEVIEEGTVSMDDMIGGEDVTLSETCTPV